jgi:hypothetical protein
VPRLRRDSEPGCKQTIRTGMCASKCTGGDDDANIMTQNPRSILFSPAPIRRGSVVQHCWNTDREREMCRKKREREVRSSAMDDSAPPSERYETAGGGVGGGDRYLGSDGIAAGNSFPASLYPRDSASMLHSTDSTALFDLHHRARSACLQQLGLLHRRAVPRCLTTATAGSGGGPERWVLSDANPVVVSWFHGAGRGGR